MTWTEPSGDRGRVAVCATCMGMAVRLPGKSEWRHTQSPDPRYPEDDYSFEFVIKDHQPVILDPILPPIRGME